MSALGTVGTITSAMVMHVETNQKTALKELPCKIFSLGEMSESQIHINLQGAIRGGRSCAKQVSDLSEKIPDFS